MVVCMESSHGQNNLKTHINVALEQISSILNMETEKKVK